VTRSERWNELQNRWVAGEALTAQEQLERAELAATDALARRELEIFAELRGRVEAHGAETPRELVDGVLDAVHGRPRLRVVAPDMDRAVPAAPRRPPRLGPIVALSAVAAAAAAGVLVYSRGRPQQPADPVVKGVVAPVPARAELVLSSGQVEIGGQLAAVGGRPLGEGDRVTTRDGRGCITIDPEVDVCLAPHTSAVIESLNLASSRVRVEAGTALATLTERQRNSSFAITAEDVSATARGTVFAVTREPSGQVEVAVVDGIVDVARGSELREAVIAHSRLRFTRSPFAVERAAIGRGEEAKLLALGAQRELWAGANVGVLEVRGREPGTQVAIDQQAPLSLPLSAFVPAGKRRIAVLGGDSEVVTFVDVVAGEARQVVVPGPVAHETGDATSVTPNAAALLGAARRELAAGHAEAALGLYQRLRASYPSSPEAKTVLVTMGKLELDRKQPGRALGHFDAYLAGGGPLAQEALAGKVHALRALGRSVEERRALERYLERHPGGFEAPGFRKRLQSLTR
jgi:hypothetical protein